jgi:hypothetical protein
MVVIGFYALLQWADRAVFLLLNAPSSSPNDEEE